MTWSAPLNRLMSRHAGSTPAMPAGLSRSVHRVCTGLGAPADVDPGAWRAEMAALAVYAAETPDGQSIVQLHAGDGRATAALAAGTSFARRPAAWAVDTFSAAGRAAAGEAPLYRALASTGLGRHVVPVTAGPTAAAGAWDGSPVGLLVLDAGVGVATCMSAYAAWSSHLVDASRVIFAGPVSASAASLLWGGSLEPLFGLGGLRVCAHHALPAVSEAARPLRRAA